MTSAETVVDRIEVAGGILALSGERIRFRLPEDAADLLDGLREHKDEVVLLLKRREKIPVMPPGVRLTRWEPKPAPVVLTQCSIVTDVPKFISSTLRQLKAALTGKRWQSGHWSVRELTDRLEQCGVLVRIGEAERGR
jgi:hypothetical protein